MESLELCVNITGYIMAAISLGLALGSLAHLVSLAWITYGPAPVEAPESTDFEALAAAFTDCPRRSYRLPLPSHPIDAVQSNLQRLLSALPVVSVDPELCSLSTAPLTAALVKLRQHPKGKARAFDEAFRAWRSNMERNKPRSLGPNLRTV